MAVTLTQMRAYANLDEDAPARDVAELEDCLAAAVSWFKHNGVPEDTQDALYDRGVKMLALSWFETRGSDVGAAMHSVPHGVDAIKHQLCALPDAGEDS